MRQFCMLPLFLYSGMIYAGSTEFSVHIFGGCGIELLAEEKGVMYEF